MNTTRLRRSLAAATIAITCLVIPADPASAAVHSVSITGGTLFVTKLTPVVSENLHNFNFSCTSPPTLSLDLGTETVGASVTVTALSSSSVAGFTTGNYLTVLTRSTVGNTSGTLGSSTTGHTISTFRVALSFRIYNTTGCTPTGTPVCTVAALLALSGTSTSTTSTNTFDLSGMSVGTLVANPTCTSGPTQILGTRSSTTASITGTLTT